VSEVHPIEFTGHDGGEMKRPREDTSTATRARPDLRSPAGLLALQSLPRIGPVRALRATLHTTHMERLVNCHGRRLEEALEQAWARVEQYARADIELLTFFDERYPDRLRELADPPPLIYVRGEAQLLARKNSVAVVGTREPTTCGAAAAGKLTAAAAEVGWSIVSGLARGIDTIAHRTAIEHEAPTIAVMGGGLDRIYPAENKSLATRILEAGGTLISEQPPGERARPHHLVARDRLQSGLSVAVVVAQSGVRSGTMHTARFAAAQGRAIFCAIPCDESDASEGQRVLLEYPARELCSILPAWHGASALCTRLGDRPLAHATSSESLTEQLRVAELAR
jgi:DNA processing protein